MLTFDVKRKINTLRDILVGKVPDPKAQVEQITIALIYKFMDDMDIEGLEFGGTRQFFTGEYEKYAWTEIMKPENSGQQRAFLYAEGIEKMATNPNLPQLFRDIFRGAYIPYRDPDTMNMFLKEVSDFSYDNSEDLGNAFEYLLSIMGSQGDAGQFRTPRHIIDMMVEIIDPKKNETILDPACGTAGFLISAYRHILAQNKDEDGKSTLTADDRKRLTENFAGYDISPDMVRLSRVNMYLHHFTKPKISEYDTLTSEEKWDDCYDVILANPPFMTPKGGIMPHSRYRVKAKRSEVLFVDYIAEHLNPTGRAAIIVPEGIVFQSANAYKELRKYLVDDGLLYAVISLPAGVFNPYSGVKTSILLIDKSFARLKDEILFVKLNNDGFDLGAQRREIEGSEIPEIIRIVQKYHADLEPQTADDEILQHPLVTIASKEQISKQDYILVGERYSSNSIPEGKYKVVSLGDKSLFQVESGGTPSSDIPEYWDGNIRWATLVDLPAANLITELKDTERTISPLGLEKSSAKLLPAGTVLVSTRATIGRVAIAEYETATNQGFKNIIVLDDSNISNRFVAYMMTALTDRMVSLASGGTFKEISKSNFLTLSIPLPPLTIQEQIVSELDNYQKIIDGARQVVDNYKPNIRIDFSWELKPLGQICDVRDGTHDSPKFVQDGFPLVTSKNIKNGTIILDDVNFISKEDYDKINQRSKVDKGDILMPMIGTIGNPVIVDIEPTFAIKNVALIKFPGQKVKSKYVLFVLNSSLFAKYIEATKRGGTQNFISLKDIRSFNIPCPAVEIQERIIKEIEEEISIVEQNKRLIDIFKQKIADKISEVWGE
ncbi:MAG: N-6 DNA methylase [Gemmiger formicilis]|uniref:N-6 DNA methylase n=1 Tax=Gemmiger formicilis TaxID=745368 RepID=UPI003999B21F